MHLISICDDDTLVGHLPEASADVVLSLGDLWDSTIEQAVARYKPEKAFAIRGNHDSTAAFPSGVASLHLTMRSYQGKTFGGFDGSWKHKSKGHHLFTQQEVTDLLSSFPPVDVFVAHNSPRGIHERDEEVHQGFDAFTSYIKRAKPSVFLHGHQHVSETTQIGTTRVIGVFGEALIKI